MSLLVHYPFRASMTSTVNCPTIAEGQREPAAQIAPIGPYSSYSTAIGLTDRTLKTETVFLRLCRDTTAAEEDKALLDLFRQQVQYHYNSDPTFQNGEQRDRHYENIRAQACAAIAVEYPSETHGSLLATDCASTQFYGGYADYYTFNVPNTQNVQVDMEWKEDFIDANLYLLRGNNIKGAYVSSNDSNGILLDARMSENLSSGDYTIVATTSRNGLSTGDYKLRIREKPACPATHIYGSSASGEWEITDCDSERKAGSYADFYTFHVATGQKRSVSIDLSWTNAYVDTYLYLISGASTEGTGYITFNDDFNGRNSRVVHQLDPGVYTLEATTYSAGAIGSYTIAISGHK